MFTAPRCIVVDDKAEHLRAIEATFLKLGSPCLGVHYDPAKPFERHHFKAVRVLVLDLNLLSGAIGTNHNQHYAQTAAILEEVISPTGGPFLLVMWSSNANLVPKLTEYLERSDLPSHCRPIAILSLPKERFINLVTGDVEDAEALPKAITDHIRSSPQIAALMAWEVSVLEAAAETLCSILALVPTDKRGDAIAQELDVVLSRLAAEAVGPRNVASDPKAAVSAALSPLLADRMFVRSALNEHSDVWTAAVTRFNDPSMAAPTAEEAGRINRMLHVAVPPAETVRPTDWGAVIECPDSLLGDNFESVFGLPYKEVLGGEFKIESESRASCKPCLIRIGAVCDYAQQRKGPVTFLLAFEVPTEAKRKRRSDGTFLPYPDSEWRSPVFVRDGANAYRLHANYRFPVTRCSADCKDWKVLYRLREQLLGQLIVSASNYIARPGIIQLSMAASSSV